MRISEYIICNPFLPSCMINFHYYKLGCEMSCRYNKSTIRSNCYIRI